MRKPLFSFFRFSPGEITVNLVLTILQGITAGTGILLLIPLLRLAGFFSGSEVDEGVIGEVQTFFGNSIPRLSLLMILGIYIAIISMFAALNYSVTVRKANIQQRYTCYLRENLYSSLLHSKWEFIVNHKMSESINILTTQVREIGFAVQHFMTLFSQLILMIFYFSVALLLSWEMSIITFICTLIMMLAVMPLNQKIHRAGQIQMGSYIEIFQMLTEQLTSLKMIKSYSAENHFTKQLLKSSEQLEQQNLTVTRTMELAKLIQIIGAGIILSIFFYISTIRLNLPLENIILLLFIYSRILPRATSSLKTLQQLIHRISAFKEASKLQSICMENKELNQNLPVEAIKFCKQISLRNVSFQFKNSEQKIIENITLDIKHNQTVAVIGPSGSGKTTLVDLIAGLLLPTSGSIYCDETKLEDEFRLAWRQNLAYVTQETYFFHDTIRANLSWVKSDVTDENIWQALELAAAIEFIRALPKGLDTIIGDRGSKLSGGERQRLALARALLTEPQLLILDEATSALDSENDLKIQQALKELRGKMTIIIIAHRQSTIKDVDAIIDLNI